MAEHLDVCDLCKCRRCISTHLVFKLELVWVLPDSTGKTGYAWHVELLNRVVRIEAKGYQGRAQSRSAEHPAQLLDKLHDSVVDLLSFLGRSTGGRDQAPQSRQPTDRERDAATSILISGMLATGNLGSFGIGRQCGLHESLAHVAEPLTPQQRRNSHFPNMLSALQ